MSVYSKSDLDEPWERLYTVIPSCNLLCGSITAYTIYYVESCADLAVLLDSNGQPAVDLPPGYVRVEKSDRRIILSAWMAFIISGGRFEGSFVPNITGNVHITWRSNYFWADYHW